MKLIVFYKGDPSVGIFPSEYEVECPFDLADTHIEELELFKDMIMDAYKEFDCNYAMYDFEIEEQNKMYLYDNIN